MASKRLTNNGITQALYSLDVGNGECKGLSGGELVKFEPVIAPISRKRDVNNDKPDFWLKTENGVQVYGVQDVYLHGQRENIHRLNSMERYTSPDYFDLIRVLLLNLFRAHGGRNEWLMPQGVISIPVEQYNDEQIVTEIKETLAGKHEIADGDGCILRVMIDAARLNVIPESTGALTHHMVNPQTLARRDGVSTGGSTLVIDPGFETTDTSLFEGMRYQRDRAFTFRRTGMGNVTRSVTEYIKTVIRDADLSRVDVALRDIAGIDAGKPKIIEPTPGKRVDVTEVYDTAVLNLSARIADSVRSAYTEDVSRVVLAGGGAYHLYAPLAEMLPFRVEIAPEPEVANLIGGMTILRLKVEGR